MTYDSVDIIPSKLFFKILETGDIKLLSDEEKNEETLNKIWIEIQSQDSDLIKDNKRDKVIDLSKRIESLLARIESIKLAVFHLKILPDDDLLELLKNFGYKFSDNLDSDLERVERETEAILLKIKIDQRRLNNLKPKKDSDKKVPFDETILSYSAFTHLNFRPNTITQSEYRALISVGNQKIEAIQKNMSNGKR